MPKQVIGFVSLWTCKLPDLVFRKYFVSLLLITSGICNGGENVCCSELNPFMVLQLVPHITNGASMTSEANPPRSFTHSLFLWHELQKTPDQKTALGNALLWLSCVLRETFLNQLFCNAGVLLKCKKMDFCRSQLLVHLANIFLGPVPLEAISLLGHCMMTVALASMVIRNSYNTAKAQKP